MKNRVPNFSSWVNENFKLKSNIGSFAERELRILESQVKDSVLKDFIPEIIQLAEKFGNSGQSGGSAPYVAQILSETIKKLCLFQPISPVMGESEEWFNPSEDCFQNTRCSALFKESEKSQAYYLDAIVFKTQRGSTWSGHAILEDGTKVWSRQYVKSYPFEPKTFVIDVIEKEVAPDDWEFIIKDKSQLDEVFEYYNMYTMKKTNESLEINSIEPVEMFEGIVIRDPHFTVTRL